MSTPKVTSPPARRRSSSQRGIPRRGSSRRDGERLALEQQVEDEFQQQQQQQIGGVGMGSLRRRSSKYLPVAQQGADDNLRVAKNVIQNVYDLHARYERQHSIENTMCVIAMIGVLLVILDNEHMALESSKLTLRSINAVLTVLLLGLVCWRFAVQRNILIRRNVLPPGVSLVRMPRQLLQLALELAICAIFVPPGTTGSFDMSEWKFYTDASATGAATSSDSVVKEACGAPFVVKAGSCYLEYAYPYEVLGLLSLLRVYMIPRVIRNLSQFSSYHTSYLGTLHRVDTMSPLFAVKCFLQSHPFRLLLGAFLGTLVLSTYALAIVESPVNPNLAPLSNAAWLVVLTMATVGYGDVAPITIAGQILLVAGGMLAGILLVCALSAALFDLLGLDERDKRFIHLLRRQEHDWALKHACARSIQAGWGRFYALRSGAEASDQRRYRKLCDNVYRCTAAQRQLRKKLVGDYTSVSTELQSCQERLLISLQLDQTATMERLMQVERRLDVLVEAATAAVYGGKA